MKEHVIVVDLGYGDAGKGTIVDWLCADATRASQARASRAVPFRTVVRFNGGAQAAHHVIAPNGRPHAFAQFGSGTFTPGTRTFLSRFMLVDPLALTAEAEHLAALGVRDPFRLIDIDRDALLTTPYHQAANRARETARGDARHGSCGMGIGETASYALAHPEDAPRAGDITSPATLIRKLAKLRDYLTAELGQAQDTPSPDTPPPHMPPPDMPPPAEVATVYQAIADRLTLTGDGHLARLLARGPVVFEGAQGVLLDEWRGFHPYTTWSTTTFENAETLLAEAGQPKNTIRLGVTRTYQTRHGPGPFPTEDPTINLPEQHNTTGRWQGAFRQGHLDAVALDYAREVVAGVDAVAVTHLDTARDHPELRIARGYDIPRPPIESPIGSPVNEPPIESAANRAEAAAEIPATEPATELTTELTTEPVFVTRIALGPHRDLEFQQALTGTLLKARPVYTTDAPRTEADWCSAIEEILRAPVIIRSTGPYVADKTAITREAISR